LNKIIEAGKNKVPYLPNGVKKIAAHNKVLSCEGQREPARFIIDLCFKQNHFWDFLQKPEYGF
jgi:hypothetical protein